MFLGNTFQKKHAFVSDVVLEFLGGDSLELKHPLYRFEAFSYPPHPMGLHPAQTHTHTRTCVCTDPSVMAEGLSPGVSCWPAHTAFQTQEA